MPEMDKRQMPDRAYKESAQIYKEKMEELFEQNQELRSQNETLLLEKHELLTQNQELREQCSRLFPKKQEALVLIGEPENAAPPKKARRVKQWILPAVTAVAFALAVFFFYRMEDFAKRYANEQDQRSKLEEAYQTAQDLQATAEAALENMLAGLSKLSEGTYGAASTTFYAEESLVVLHVGQVRTVRLHMPKYFSVRSAPSDEEALDTTVTNTITSGLAKLEIEAHQPGMYTVTLQYGQSFLSGASSGSGQISQTAFVIPDLRSLALQNQSFEILVLVLED